VSRSIAIPSTGLKFREARTEEDGALKRRGLSLDVRQLDKEKRTLPISFSSETREVMTYDWEIGGMVPEILSHSPSACDLAPLLGAGSVLRNHDANQIVGVPVDASIDEKAKRGVATIRFGTTDCAEKTFREVADGILRGVSVGYEVMAYERVKAGGRSSQGHEGPCMVATAWRVHELTLTPIPADSSVGVGRSSRGTPTTKTNEKEFEMDKKTVFAMVRAAGLPESFAVTLIARELADADAVATAITEEKKIRAKKRKKLVVAARSEESAEDREDEEIVDDEDDDLEDDDARSTTLSEREKGVRAERKRQDTIRSAVSAAKLPAEFANELVEKNASIDKARALIIEKLAAGDMPAVNAGARGADVERGGDGGEKKLRFLTVNLGRRAFAAIGEGVEFDDETTKNVERAHISLQMAVREVLEMRGVPGARFMEPYDLWTNFLRTNGQRAANTSGDLANALSNLQNKALSRGFNLAKPTWKSWCTKGSLNDFKIAPWVQMSEAGQLAETGENGEILDTKFNDRAENRQLAVYARKASLTWQAFQNDDIGAVAKVPFKLGQGAAKLPSRLAYAHLLANPTMSDGVALFHADHGNLLTGAGSNLDATNKFAALVAAEKAFRKQVEPKAPNDTAFANEPIDIEPGVMILPPEHSYHGSSLVNPNMFTADAGAPYFKSKYAVEVESRLSNTGYTGYSLTAWYLAAAAADMETMEVSFLNGNESPLTATWEEFAVLAMHFRAVLPCAAKALDWRGIVRSNGV